MEKLDLTRLKKEDFYDLINLLNGVFSTQNGCKMDFESDYPRIFVPNDRTMSWHLGAKIDGKLCGTAASYPLTYRVGGTDLKISASGNIAVDSTLRGRGIMQSLLNKLDAEDREANFDISYLHGDRFRYRNFGYERCGVEYYFNLTRQMLGKDAPEKHFTYINLRESEEELIKKVFDFYNTQSTYLIRDYESFMPALTTKKRIPLAVISNEKELLAYLTVSPKDHCVSEIFVKDENLFADIVKSYMEKFDTNVLYLGLPAYSPLVKEALRIADRYHAMQPGNFKIYNFKRVVESFMREKCLHEYLPDGIITLDSEIFGKWSIEKKDENICVLPYSGIAQFSLPGYEIYPFLFGTFMPMVNTKSKEYALLKSWFPLPLYCPYLT